MSMREPLQFRLLGPLEIWMGGRRVQLTAPRLQSTLGMLLVRANRVVSVEHLAQCVWEERQPADPANQIAVCISKLRGRFSRLGLSHELITTEPPGYLLTTRGVELDTHLVHTLRAEAERCVAAGDRGRAIALLEEALSQWRGPLLAGLTRQAWQAEVSAWEEERVTLRVKWAELQLELGRYEPLIGELTAFVQQNPFFERPRAQLMTALYLSGRQADALRLFRETSRMLDRELAVTPGPELQRLHQEILRGAVPAEPSATELRLPAGPPPAPVGGPAAPHAEAVVPREALGVDRPATDRPTPGRPGPALSAGPCLLPSDIDDFVGREREIATLVERLAPSRGQVPLVEVVGAGGTGKTALAVHVAHALRPQFPDGQLYINLRGMDDDPVAPEEALARLLAELSTAGSVLPEGLDQRSEKYRALLADQRILVVLDNAADAAQIRPLLPGTGSCAVIVTGRSRVASSFATHVVELGILSREHALELLRRVAGPERPTAEPEAARRLVDYCGWLPLAVSIVAAKLAAKPHWTLERVAARLADEQRRLDELEHDSLAVRTTFALSYQGISADARTLLRRLALLPVPDFSDWPASPLVGLDAHETEKLIEELVDARLVEVVGTDRAGQLRYRIHDLLRLFGLERAAGTDAHPELREAVSRTARAALARADLAHRTVCGGDYTVVRSTVPRPDTARRARELTRDERAASLDWYESERLTITALVKRAAEYGLDGLAWDLAAVCRCLFSTRGHHDEWLTTHRWALRAVRESGSGRGRAALLLGLGDLHLTKRHHAEARACLEEAHRTFLDVGDEYGAALALRRSGYVDRLLGRYEQALERWRGCLPALRAAGDLQAQVQVHRQLGLTLLELHDLDGAEPHLKEAEDLTCRFHGRGAGQVRLALADLLRARRRLDEAETEYLTARELTDAIGDVVGSGYAHFGLGIVALERGEPTAAERLLDVCVESAREVGDPLLEALGLFGLSAAHGHSARPREAEVLLDRAARLYRDLGTPVRYARCLYAQAGVIAQRDGDPVVVSALRARAAAAVASTGSPLAARAFAENTRPHYPFVL